MMNRMDQSAAESITTTETEGVADNGNQALSLMPQRLDEHSSDRCNEIRRLLLDVMAQGPWPLESRIDALSILRELNDGERQVVHQIYQLCHETAEREADEKRIWRYQRLLRTMALKGAAPSGAGQRPDPLSSLDPRSEFSDESEESLAVLDEESPVEVRAKTPVSGFSFYDAVFPASLFIGAALAFWVTFQSGGSEKSDALSAQVLAMPSISSSGGAATAQHGTSLFEPTELQVAEATAATEANKNLPTTESVVASTSGKDNKDAPKPVESATGQKPPVTSVAPTTKPSMLQPVVPAKASFELAQPERDASADESRPSLPARRSLGPSMAVPELEAQLEALKAQTRSESSTSSATGSVDSRE